MTKWIIIAALYPTVLLAFSRLGGIGAVAEGLREWGCASGGFGRMQARSE
jgi:hypothetical protein